MDMYYALCCALTIKTPFPYKIATDSIHKFLAISKLYLRIFGETNDKLRITSSAVRFTTNRCSDWIGLKCSKSENRLTHNRLTDGNYVFMYIYGQLLLTLKD
uniref:Uncharacterized protein n=1 Tax=Glossina pallidipes TaxID=7398 RepID=A0A1B0AEA1_GLOPL